MAEKTLIIRKKADNEQGYIERSKSEIAWNLGKKDLEKQGWSVYSYADGTKPDQSETKEFPIGKPAASHIPVEIKNMREQKAKAATAVADGVDPLNLNGEDGAGLKPVTGSPEVKTTPAKTAEAKVIPDPATTSKK